MAKTLYIGLGGLGGRVVAEIRENMRKVSDDSGSSSFVVLDRDVHDLKLFAREDIECVSLHLHGLVKYYMERYENIHIQDWFPASPAIVNSEAEVNGMFRVLGRLSFLDAARNEKIDHVKAMADQLMMKGSINDNLRVIVVTSLSGGTGAGMFTQMALWLRKQFKEVLDTEVYGLFVAPEVFIDSFDFLKYDRSMCASFKANAYAALKELELIAKIKREGFSALPYRIYIDDLFDSCEKQDEEPVFDKVYIYDKTEPCNSSENKFSGYINRIGKFAVSGFVSSASDTSVAIEKYLVTSQDCKEVYKQICERAKRPGGERFDPHIDKRWLAFFTQY